MPAMICPLCDGTPPAPYPDEGWEPACYLCDDKGRVSILAGWLFNAGTWMASTGARIMDMAHEIGVR